MLNLNSLLLPGESPELLLALLQEWYVACAASTPTEMAWVHDAVAADWLFRRMDRRYWAMRDPAGLDTDHRPLKAVSRRRNELRCKVAKLKTQLGYSQARIDLSPLLSGSEDFDCIRPIGQWLTF